MSHTPGPFELESYPDMDGYKIRGGGQIFGGRKRLLAVVKNQDSAPVYESQDNARLFAAAPDLLAFVREQEAATVCICNFKAAGYTEMPCIKCAARELISKVEGWS